MNRNKQRSFPVKLSFDELLFLILNSLFPQMGACFRTHFQNLQF